MQTLLNWVLDPNWDKEVTRYHLGAMVNKLVEYELAIGPWLPHMIGPI